MKRTEMKPSAIEHETWLDLSHAASYLGVHFKTLRRWADTGAIACARTPGGRRRFSVRALDDFAARSDFDGKAEPSQAMIPAQPAPDLPDIQLRDRVSHDLHALPVEGNLLLRLTVEQRARLKGTGQRLTALLLQYNSRCDGSGAMFLDEGRRLAREYSQACRDAGLSVRDTAQIFLFFRRSILGGIYQTAHLGSCDDLEGDRLYTRSTDFLDQLLLDLIGSYLEA